MTREQKQKIRDLKNQIKDNKATMKEMLENLDIEKENVLPQEEQDKNKKEFGDKLAMVRANITAAQAQIKEARLNPLGSSFFSYEPHTGMNRRQARAFRRLRAQGKIKVKK